MHQDIAQDQHGASQPPKSHSSSKLFLMLGILILLVLVGTGSYVLGTKTAQSEPQIQPAPIVKSTPIPTIDPNTDWKTYTSTEGKYTFQYPKEWSFEKFDDKNPQAYGDNKSPYKAHVVFENKPLTTQGQGATDLEKGRVFGEMQIVSTESLCGLSCKNMSEKDFFNPKNDLWKIGNIGGGGPGTTVESVVESMVGGKRTMVVVSHPSTSYEGDYPTDQHISYNVYLGNKNYEVLLISFNYGNTYKGKDELLKIFDKILQTFKFTDGNMSIDTSDWKTYTNQKYGFGFKYPSTICITDTTNQSSIVCKEDLGIGISVDKPDTFDSTLDNGAFEEKLKYDPVKKQWQIISQNQST
jgi:glycerophosphoryl diester phosphodiesterase